ncbi:hypothetical protein X275_00745 [Marinitoga sp. 1197]|uniref:TolB family protein n=1 Tax=Marinitoga sp. 1197 TaxID=1428449 RepID=UPI000640E2F9|nr:hypothetical protein [Marinitoga sp. 1197]KLO24245.1 hypothetical protein X275_00745 [Marinitoga sp. 1197]
MKNIIFIIMLITLSILTQANFIAKINTSANFETNYKNISFDDFNNYFGMSIGFSPISNNYIIGEAKLKDTKDFSLNIKLKNYDLIPWGPWFINIGADDILKSRDLFGGIGKEFHINLFEKDFFRLNIIPTILYKKNSGFNISISAMAEIGLLDKKEYIENINFSNLKSLYSDKETTKFYCDHVQIQSNMKKYDGANHDIVFYFEDTKTSKEYKAKYSNSYVIFDEVIKETTKLKLKKIEMDNKFFTLTSRKTISITFYIIKKIDNVKIEFNKNKFIINESEDVNFNYDIEIDNEKIEDLEAFQKSLNIKCEFTIYKNNGNKSEKIKNEKTNTSNLTIKGLYFSKFGNYIIKVKIYKENKIQNEKKDQISNEIEKQILDEKDIQVIVQPEFSKINIESKDPFLVEDNKIKDLNIKFRTKQNNEYIPQKIKFENGIKYNENILYIPNIPSSNNATIIKLIPVKIDNYEINQELKQNLSDEIKIKKITTQTQIFIEPKTSSFKSATTLIIPIKQFKINGIENDFNYLPLDIYANNKKILDNDKKLQEKNIIIKNTENYFTHGKNEIYIKLNNIESNHFFIEIVPSKISKIYFYSQYTEIKENEKTKIYYKIFDKADIELKHSEENLKFKSKGLKIINRTEKYIEVIPEKSHSFGEIMATYENLELGNWVIKINQKETLVSDFKLSTKTQLSTPTKSEEISSTIQKKEEIITSPETSKKTSEATSIKIKLVRKVYEIGKTNIEIESSYISDKLDLFINDQKIPYKISGNRIIAKYDQKRFGIYKVNLKYNNIESNNEYFFIIPSSPEYIKLYPEKTEIENKETLNFEIFDKFNNRIYVKEINKNTIKTTFNDEIKFKTSGLKLELTENNIILIPSEEATMVKVQIFYKNKKLKELNMKIIQKNIIKKTLEHTKSENIKQTQNATKTTIENYSINGKNSENQSDKVITSTNIKPTIKATKTNLKNQSDKSVTPIKLEISKIKNVELNISKILIEADTREKIIEPKISPDGKHIVYIRLSNENISLNIYEINKNKSVKVIGTTSIRKRKDQKYSIYQFYWLNNKEILYTMIKDNSYNIYLYNLQNKTNYILMESENNETDFDIFGNNIAWISNAGLYYGKIDLTLKKISKVKEIFPLSTDKPITEIKFITENLITYIYNNDIYVYSIADNKVKKYTNSSELIKNQINFVKDKIIYISNEKNKDSTLNILDINTEENSRVLNNLIDKDFHIAAVNNFLILKLSGSEKYILYDLENKIYKQIKISGIEAISLNNFGLIMKNKYEYITYFEGFNGKENIFEGNIIIRGE